MSLRNFVGRVVRPKIHSRFGELLSIEIGDDDLADEFDGSTADDAKQGLSGLSLVIEYQNSKGEVSQRVVTCRNLQLRASKQYIQAFCHHRNGLRTFRLDRIAEIFDPITGESLSPVQTFFAQFSPDRVTKSGLSWNLSVSRRADLLGMLNALVFLARCDREFHPFETQSLEQAVTKFWLEFDLTAECEIDDIIAYAERLAPDGETFWIAMHRFREEPILGRVFRRAAHHLIAADGVVRPEESYWSIEIDDFLAGG